MEIKGKTAVVTGAARGIGQGIAEAFAQEGANVVAADLGLLASKPTTDWGYSLSAKAELDATAQVIRDSGGSCETIDVDVSDRASCQSLVEKVVETFGRLDILVNNAGVVQSGPTVDFAESDWDRTFDVNVKGIFLLSQAAIPRLMKNGGVIINIASVAGKRGYPQMAAYCSSKFAAIGLTQSLAAELADAAIRVNAICPGVVPTSMWLEHLAAPERRGRRFGTGTVEETYNAVVENSIPLNREQTPADIADAALYLARADNVTGISLTVAGGMEMN